MLDGDWEKIPPADRAAFQFTLKLTRQPHLIGLADIDNLRKHFSASQVAEMTQAVAGYNATNRWTDALNIPGEETGDFFKRVDSAGPRVELDTFLTPTSSVFARQQTSVAPVKAEAAVRVPLEPLGSLPGKMSQIASRKILAPLGGEPAEPGWVRLMKAFPVANKGRLSTLLAAETKGKLDQRSRLLVAWSCARQDRAWYMQGLIARRMTAAGMDATELKKIDDNDASLPPADRAVINLARKMSIAPWTVTDGDIALLRKHYTDFQVAEIVLHGCNAAYLDRVTEVAQLSSSPESP